jgi:uroporphyrinogen decarboxylase
MESMTLKQGVQSLVEKKQPTRLPYHCNLTRKIKDNLAAHYGIAPEAVERHVGNALLYLSFKEPSASELADPRNAGLESHEGGTYRFKLKRAGDGALVDEFGIAWNNESAYETGDWGMVDHPVKNTEVGSYRFPDGRAPGRFRGVEKIVTENPDRFNVLLMVGLFDTAWHVTGIQDLLMGMALEDSRFVEDMLDRALEFNVGVIEQMPEYIDGVRFMEDWGQQKGLLMGLESWRRFIKPRLRQMYAAVKKRGRAVMAHSCGDITLLFPDLIDLGVDIVDPLQPEVMDLPRIKREYGRSIALFGGLGCQSTLPKGTPAQVVAEARERLRVLGEGGGYILGSAGSIPTDVPTENVVALFEYCRGLEDG